MKWKLLLCVAAFTVAGCASQRQGSYAGYGEFGFTYDAVPAPLEGLTSADVESINGSPVVSVSSGYGQGY